MPYIQLDRFVVIEQLLYKLYLEDQAEVIGDIVGLSLLASAYASSLYQIQITYPLALDVWHEVVEFVQGNGRGETFAGIVNLC